MYQTPKPRHGHGPRDFFAVIGQVLDQLSCPFLIPDLQRDTPKGTYVTIELAFHYSGPGEAHVRAWYATVTAFFSLVQRELQNAAKGDALAEKRAKALLAIGETPETRLGFSVFGSNGRGIGDGDLRDDLYNLLLLHPEVLTACTTRPDSLSMAPGFALDRVSDVMLGIGKRHVIEFTKEMATLLGFDPSCMQDVKIRDVWNPATESYADEVHQLPVDDDGNTILLVPSALIRSAPPMNVRQYQRDYLSNEGGGSITKLEVLEDAAANPGRLLDFAKYRLNDPTRFQCRRDLRPKRPRRRKK